MKYKIFRFCKQSASVSELEGLFCEAKNVALCVSNERNHLVEVWKHEKELEREQRQEQR